MSETSIFINIPASSGSEDAQGTKSWYAMHCKPNKEVVLSLELTNRKIEHYLPRVKVLPSNPRSRSIRPFFPGYLFVHIDLSESARSALNWLPHSHGLVGFGGDPVEIHESIIHGMQKKLDEMDYINHEMSHGFNKGDKVWISAGPFAGHEAIFDLNLSGAERVRVLLTLLSKQQIPLEIPADQILKQKPKTIW